MYYFSWFYGLAGQFLCWFPWAHSRSSWRVDWAESLLTGPIVGAGCEMKCLISPPCGFLSSSKSHQLAYMVVIEQHSSFGDPVSRTHEKSVLPHANDQNKFKVYPDTKDQNPDLLYSYKKILISYTAIKNLQPNLMFCCFLKITHENRPQRENFKLPEDKTVPFSFVLCASPVHRIPLGMVCRFSLMLLDGELSALPN